MFDGWLGDGVGIVLAGVVVGRTGAAGVVCGKRPDTGGTAPGGSKRPSS